MRETPHGLPTIESDGPLFHVATLRDVIPGGPNGVFIDRALLTKRPVLRERDRDNLRYRFVAFDPYPTSPPRLDGCLDVPIQLYAEALPPYDGLSSLINAAMSNGSDPAELTTFVENILRQGFDLSYEFINILRQDYGQYYLQTPESLPDWAYAYYYSKSHERWFVIHARALFEETLLRRTYNEDNEKLKKSWVLPRTIREPDLEGLAAADSASRQSFADEMIYTALVELRHHRIRSAIIHAFIAYESVAKRALEYLVENRLKGLESGAVLEAVTREVSTVTLGRIVLYHARPEVIDPPLDWRKLDALYNNRNMIVHRGRRRMPPFEEVKAQVLEVWSFVTRLQAALRNGGVDRA